MLSTVAFLPTLLSGEYLPPKSWQTEQVRIGFALLLDANLLGQWRQKSESSHSRDKEFLSNICTDRLGRKSAFRGCKNTLPRVVMKK